MLLFIVHIHSFAEYSILIGQLQHSTVCDYWYYLCVCVCVCVCLSAEEGETQAG